MDTKQAIEICKRLLTEPSSGHPLFSLEHSGLTHLITEAEAVEEMLAEATVIEFDKLGEPLIQIWKTVRHSEQEWATRRNGISTPGHDSALAAFKSLKESK